MPKNSPSNASSSLKTHKRKSGIVTSRVAIIGGGRGGTALMEIFAEDPLVTVVGLAEIRPQTAGVRLAKKLNIPVVRNYHDLLKLKDVDLVIDVTGDPEVERVLLQVEAPHLALVGGASAKFMWQLIEARILASAEIEKTLTRYQSLFRLYVKEEAEGAVDDERTRIACEIHDGLVQTLVGVNFKMERCRELVPEDPNKCLQLLSETTHQLKDAIQEARQVVYNLRPGQYDHLALLPAFSNYLKSYESQHRIQTEFEPGGQEPPLDPKTKVFVFRMVQEALNNVAKHAKATKVKVSVLLEEQMLEAVVSDNGVGFDIQAESQNPDKWDHFGVRGMMERARMLGGEVAWNSEPGKGTTVTFHVPFAGKEKRFYGQKD